MEDTIDSDVELAKLNWLLHEERFKNWSAKDGISVETAKQVVEYMKTMQEGDCYLVHCKAGADRTGLFCALFRIFIQGWPVWKAKLETIAYGHIPFKYTEIFKSIDAAVLEIKR